MALTIVAQRCMHHPGREAVARCPVCTHFFCRECITEHEDRVICSSCLKKLTAKPKAARRNFSPVLRTAAAVMGIFVAWIFFFIVGRLLVNIPASFHESTIWERGMEDLRDE
jgi:hypothetical protein